jgi:hypothetical protein
MVFVQIVIFITNEESVELALKTYIHLIYEQMNSDRVTLLTDLLESMVEYNVVSAR